jgi:membrane fusion protein, multidrug efflux system
MPTDNQQQQQQSQQQGQNQNGNQGGNQVLPDPSAQNPANQGQEQNHGQNQSQGQGQQNNNQNEKKEPPPDPAKKRRTMIIAGIVGLVVILVAVGFYLYSRTYEDTDDAQIDGHLNPISARVNGTIKAVYVEDNQTVTAGQSLVDLDPADSETALAASQAQYDQSLAQLQAEQPNLPITITANQTDTATANESLANAAAALAGAEQDYQTALQKLAQAEADNGKAQSDVKRYKELLDKNEVAQSEYDQYDAAAKAQAAGVGAQKAAVASAEKTIDQKRALLAEQEARQRQTLQNAPRNIAVHNATIQQRKAAVESAAAQLKQDKLNLGYTHIVSPVNGIVTERSAELGGRVSIGQQMMLVVQTDNLWVTANFKETQLRKVRQGQRVTIAVDGLDRKFEGYVQAMPAATGDRTSALPPENATGNYVKVVQRMPVRIYFNPNQEGLNMLRPGMSVVPTIHLN